MGIYGSAVGLSIVALAAAIWWIEPAPPSTIRLATGASGGAYSAWGEQYRQILGEQGIEVELLETSGAVENLQRLSDGKADVALLQAGLPLADGDRDVQALASIGAEPSWIGLLPLTLQRRRPYEEIATLFHGPTYFAVIVPTDRAVPAWSLPTVCLR